MPHRSPSPPRHRRRSSYDYEDGKQGSSSSSSRSRSDRDRERRMDRGDDEDDRRRGSASGGHSHRRERDDIISNDRHDDRRRDRPHRDWRNDDDNGRRGSHHRDSGSSRRHHHHQHQSDVWMPSSSSRDHRQDLFPQRDDRERERSSHHRPVSPSRRSPSPPRRRTPSPSRRQSIDMDPRDRQHRRSSPRRSDERPPSSSSSHHKGRELFPSDRPSSSSSASGGLSIKGSSSKSISIRGTGNNDSDSQPLSQSSPDKAASRQGASRVFDSAMMGLERRDERSSPSKKRSSSHERPEREERRDATDARDGRSDERSDRRDGGRDRRDNRYDEKERRHHRDDRSRDHRRDERDERSHWRDDERDHRRDERRARDDGKDDRHSRMRSPPPRRPRSRSRSKSPPRKLPRRVPSQSLDTANGSESADPVGNPSASTLLEPPSKPGAIAKPPSVRSGEPDASSSNSAAKLASAEREEHHTNGHSSQNGQGAAAALAAPSQSQAESQDVEMPPPQPAPTKTPTPPPPAEEPPPSDDAPPPPPLPLFDDAAPMTAAQRRRAIRSRLKPLSERTFVGCSQTSAYRKVDDNEGGLLGVGTFGEVSRARHIETGRDVALKKIKFQANDASNGMPITAIREIRLLKRLAHPNVCPVIDMVYEPAGPSAGASTVYMVLPYMQHDLNGLLERLDSEEKPFTPAQIKLYMKQLLEGTLYLHQNKILHRDIKAANILISNDGSLRIADFGLARAYHDPGDATQDGTPAWKMDPRTGLPGWQGGSNNYTGMVVTRWYRPPELLAGERKYGPAVDMWGIGCLLAEMILRRPLFKGSCEVNQLELIADLCGSPDETNYPGWSSLPGVKNFDHNGKSTDERGRVDFGRKRRMVRERFQGMVRAELADLIDKLLALDPRKRLTAEGALRHAWFDVEPLPADPASLPQYPESRESTKNSRPVAGAGAAVARPVQQQFSHQQQHQYQQHQHQHQQQQPRPSYPIGPGHHGPGGMQHGLPRPPQLHHGMMPPGNGMMPRGPAGSMAPRGPAGNMYGGGGGGPGPRPPPFNPYAQQQHTNPYAGGGGGMGGMRR